MIKYTRIKGKTMKKNFIIAIIFILLVTASIVWMTKDSTIYIAALGNYTSTTSSGSVDTFRIVEYVIDRLNEEGKDYSLIRFEIEEYPDLADLEKAFINNKIDVIIGPNSTSEAEPLYEFLASLDKAVFLTNVASDKFTGKDDNIFRINSTVSKQATQVGSVMMAKTNKQPITIYYTQDNIKYSKSYARIVKDLYSKNNIEANIVEVGSLEEIEVQAILKSKVDTEVGLIIAGPGKAGIITELISLSNESMTFYHGAWGMSDDTLEYMANVSNDIYSIGYVLPVYKDNYNEFVDVILNEIGVIQTIFCFSAYETAYFMDYVLSESKSLELEDMKEFVNEIGVYQGAFHDFYFESYGDFAKEFSLYKVEDNNYIIDVDYLRY